MIVPRAIPSRGAGLAGTDEDLRNAPIAKEDHNKGAKKFRKKLTGHDPDCAPQEQQVFVRFVFVIDW